MKTIFSISILLFFLFACSENSNFLIPTEQNIFRAIAYYSLDEFTRQTIIEDWRKVPVYYGKYHADQNGHEMVIESEYNIWFLLYDQTTLLIENQKLVAVTFHTKSDPALGPITTIIDYESNTIIGGVPRM